MILNNQVALFCGNYLWTWCFDNMRWDSRSGDGAGRGQVFTGHRGPRESLSGTEQYGDSYLNAQHCIDIVWWQTTGVSGNESKGSDKPSPLTRRMVMDKNKKKNNPQASVSVQSVYAIGICCDQVMIHKRLSAYSHQHPTDQKNNFNLVWTDWDALNCSGVVDSLDTVCALTQIKWQLSVWLLSESQELCMWMIRTLFCVSILGH